MSDKKQSADVGVSSCISGNFSVLNNQPDESSRWSFCYNKSENSACMSVFVSTPPLIIDNSLQHLESDLSVDDINQLITWLYQVKNQMSQAQNKSKSDSDSSS